MSYISKYDTRFLTHMNRKYSKHKVLFNFFDDYVMWLFYEFCKSDRYKYYKQLEKDLWEYVEFQNGREREVRDKLDGKWKN